MKKSHLLFTALLILAIILTACSAKPDITGEWKLVSYGDTASPTPTLPDVDTSIQFENGQMNGNVGCNGFGGDFKVNGSTITFGPIMSTMMACADPIMQQESTVFTVFANSATFKIDGKTLTITSADGGSAVVFEHK